MPPPFNIDNSNPTPSSFISAFPANEQANRTLIEEWLAWISDPATGFIRATVLPATERFPTGTKVPFHQTNAPTGWTKQTDTYINNSVVRAVSSSVINGGTQPFTGIFTANRIPAGTIGGTTAGHSLTNAQLASHTHSFSDTDTTSVTGVLSLGITTTPYVPGSTGSGSVILRGSVESGTSVVNTLTGGDHSHSVGVAGNTNSSGVGEAHSHGGAGLTFTGSPMDFAVRYVDLIIAAKDAP